MQLIRKATLGDLKYIVHLANKESESIGFIPACRYAEVISADRNGSILRICVREGERVGFIYSTFMERLGRVRIQQIVIQNDARRQECGTALVHATTALSNAVWLSARCAETNKAKEFWEGIGCHLVRSISQENKRDRKILVFGKVVGGLFADRKFHRISPPTLEAYRKELLCGQI